MKFINVYKKIKSTLLGLALIGVSVYLMANAITFDYYINGGLIFCGVGLMFSGEKFIEKIESFVFGKVLFKNKENETGNGQ